MSRNRIVMGGSLKLSVPTILAGIPELAVIAADMERRKLRLSRDIVIGEVTRSLMVRFAISWKAGRMVVKRMTFEIPLWAFSGHPASQGESS